MYIISDFFFGGGNTDQSSADPWFQRSIRLCGGITNIPSSRITAEAELPPAENWAACPLLFEMVAVREKVSSISIRSSLLIVMEHAGVELAPGVLPARNVVTHVTPMKSAPSLLRERLR